MKKIKKKAVKGEPTLTGTDPPFTTCLKKLCIVCMFLLSGDRSGYSGHTAGFFSLQILQGNPVSRLIPYNFDKIRKGHIKNAFGAFQENVIMGIPVDDAFHNSGNHAAALLRLLYE